MRICFRRATLAVPGWLAIGAADFADSLVVLLAVLALEVDHTTDLPPIARLALEQRLLALTVRRNQRSWCCTLAAENYEAARDHSSGPSGITVVGSSDPPKSLQ